MRLMNVIIAAVLLVSALAGCGGDGNSPVSSDEHISSGDTSITIRIGNLTDITGPGSVGMDLVNTSLLDIVKYYNENDLIPGVEFEVVNWDGQMDPSRTIPGYEWLLHKGVDIFTTPAPGVAVTLKPRVEADKEVLFTMVGNLEAIQPPGYVFSLGTVAKHEAYTLLSWIAQNDWDYEKNGPAKIGGAAWMEPYSSDFLQAMKEYAEVHPDQFEFIGEYLTNFTFTWDSEAELLKECDYVYPNILMNNFAEQFRNVGGTGRMIGGSPHTAFFKQLSDGEAWPFIDGMLIIYAGYWWNETGEEIDLEKALLYEYHPDSAEEIMSRGSGYLAIGSHLKMLEIVENAIQTSGIEGFDSQALYDAAQSYSKSIDGRDAYTFTSTKRYIANELGILEVNAEQRTLIRNDPNWYPILTEP